jgi:hypothetical protein
MAVAGGYGALFATNQSSRVLAALTMVLGLSAAVMNWLAMRDLQKVGGL